MKSKSRMDISTVIGFVIGVGCVVYGVLESPDVALFWNLPSFLIIIGSTVGAVIVAFPPEQLKNLGRVFMRGFRPQKFDLAKDINSIVELSQVSRSKGLLALEDVSHQYENDSFLYKGILLLTDGVTAESLQENLGTDIYFSQKRHKQGQAMMGMIASNVTALGLLGTYVGLIPMLNNLSDPSTLGPMMAIELVSSFYGAFISYVVFSPLLKRLQIMATAEVMRKQLIIEGLTLIQKGENPRVIQEHLLAALTSRQIRNSFGASGKGALHQKAGKKDRSFNVG